MFRIVTDEQGNNIAFRTEDVVLITEYNGSVLSEGVTILLENGIEIDVESTLENILSLINN